MVTSFYNSLFKRDLVIAAVSKKWHVPDNIVAVRFNPEEDRPLRCGVPFELPTCIGPGLPFKSAEALIIPIGLHDCI